MSFSPMWILKIKKAKGLTAFDTNNAVHAIAICMSGSVDFNWFRRYQDELKQTRANIKTVLYAIIAEQKSEAAKRDKALTQRNGLQQAGSH
jgi:hypothetical protein